MLPVFFYHVTCSQISTNDLASTTLLLLIETTAMTTKIRAKPQVLKLNLLNQPDTLFSMTASSIEAGTVEFSLIWFQWRWGVHHCKSDLLLCLDQHHSSSSNVLLTLTLSCVLPALATSYITPLCFFTVTVICCVLSSSPPGDSPTTTVCCTELTTHLSPCDGVSIGFSVLAYQHLVLLSLSANI